MLIRLEPRLAAIEADFTSALKADDISIKRTPVGGTLAVINGTLDFNKTDGYIQFIKIVLDQITNTYGQQDKNWQTQLDRIYTTAEKLQDKNVRFKGKTKAEFKTYCENLSHVMENETKTHLKTIGLTTVENNNLIPVLQKHVEAGSIHGFYYTKDEDAKKGLMDDLMIQLNGLKFEHTPHQSDISYFLMGTGYHEHVHDVLNMLMSTAVYAVNCMSTKQASVYDFDMKRVYHELRYAEFTMKSIKDLV